MALLSFILGATDTSNGPEVAPAGIVAMIEVLVHILTVMGTFLIVTKLPPCDAPKPVPLMAT
jgi:hypothetical protein